MERASQNAYSIEPNRSILGGRGDLTPWAILEIVPSWELGTRVNQNTENEGNNSFYLLRTLLIRKALIEQVLCFLTSAQ